jgi:hypothetical protein
MSDLKTIAALKGNIFAITTRIKRIMGRGEAPTDIVDLEQTIKLCDETSALLPSDGALRVMRSVTNYGRWDFTHIALSERIAALEAEVARKDAALQGARIVLEGITTASSKQWDMPLDEFHQEFVPWVKNLSRHELSRMNTALKPETKEG